MNKEEILSLSEEEQMQLLNAASAELLDILSDSSSIEIRRSVAAHMYTSVETLRKLYYVDTPGYGYYRYMSLRNINAPEDILIHHQAERLYLTKPLLKLAH